MLMEAVAEVTGAAREELLEAYRRHGDLGEAARELVEARGGGALATLVQAEPLSLRGLYGELTRLARISGEGSYQRKLSRVRGLLASCSPRRRSTW
jgi:DNA ligase N terminus.